MDLAKISADIEQKVESLRSELNYNPWFFLGFRTRHLQDQITFTSLQGNKIKQWATLHQDLTLLKERHDQALKLEQSRFQTEQHQAQATIELAITEVERQVLNRKMMYVAAEMGLTLESFQAIKIAEHSANLEMRKAEHQTQLSIHEHKERTAIDIQAEKQKAQIAIDVAVVRQQFEVQQIRALFDEVIRYKRELHQLEFSGKPIIEIELQRPNYTQVIEGLEEKLNGLLNGRLLEAVDGQVVTRTIPTDFTGSRVGTVETTVKKSISDTDNGED